MATHKKTGVKRIAVFVDGSNFYFKLRSLGVDFKSLTEIDYHSFATWLSRGRQLVYKGYYVGVIRGEDKKGKQLQEEQESLFRHLESSSQKFIVKKGFILKKGASYQEKGVDVQLAIDLLVGAYEDLYDTAVLVSSDTDLIPAIKQVQKLGKAVEYLGTAKEPSLGLQQVVSMTRLIRKEDAEWFVKDTSEPSTQKKGKSPDAGLNS